MLSFVSICLDSMWELVNITIIPGLTFFSVCFYSTLLVWMVCLCLRR